MDSENNHAEGKLPLSPKDLAILETSDRDQKKFRAFASNSKLFSAEEISSLNVHSVAEFETFWNLAIDSRRRLEANREHGIRKVIQKAQQGLSSAHDILQHIDPILQIVKAVGTPYGGMAIGTISFLFTVAKNRDNIENSISDVLLQFRDRMAGLKVYRHIYNDGHELDQQLQSRIIEGYSCFMAFCMEAARYYSTGGMTRWLKAMWGTSIALDDRADAVKKAIFDIRYMGEELLNKNVDYIKQQNEDLKVQVAKLETEVQGLRQAKDNDRLIEIQELLNFKQYSRKFDLELLDKYEDNLRATFNQTTWAGLEILRGQRLEAFKNNCSDMNRWLQAAHSSMLVLAGYNEVSVACVGTCWLSPVALDRITTLRSSKQADPYAFYIPGLHEEKIDLLPQVLSHIAIQLLTANRRALRHDTQYNELRRKIHHYLTAANDTELAEQGQISVNASRALQEVVLEVLNIFGEEQTVWIVVDRADQCKRRGGPNHQKKLTQALVNLLETAKATVRVLLVVNGHDWRVDEQANELENSKQDSVVVHRVDQRPIDNWTV